MKSYAHDTFLSPFTWRYASAEMRAIWSEVNKRRLWRRIWVALAEVQAEYGLVTPAQVADLKAHMSEIDLPKALEVEMEKLTAAAYRALEKARLMMGREHVEWAALAASKTVDVHLKLRGIMGVAIPVIDATGHVYISVGNGSATTPPYGIASAVCAGSAPESLGKAAS